MAGRHIALVCDWLTTPGGAEKVLLELHRMYPNAPIYTSQYRPKKITWFQDANVKTGWLQFLPACFRRILGPLRQLYFSHLDLTEYDLVISVTGAEAKSVKARKHLCYCHVPTQYYWQMYDKYIKDPGFGIFDPFVRFFFKLLVKPLRRLDYRAAQRPDQFVTISSYAAKQIKNYYHRDAQIVYPAVDVAKFMPKKSTKNAKTPTREIADPYFVISCRHVTWKRVDLAIAACIKAKKSLLVIGDGPEHANLEKLAAGSDLITFISWLGDEELSKYLQAANAYIFPSVEPFGIAAVEALAAGCPVIAYDEGGSRDFVIPEKNGMFFPEQTASSLATALKKFRPEDYKRPEITASAQKFAPNHFQIKVKRLVKELLNA